MGRKKKPKRVEPPEVTGYHLASFAPPVKLTKEYEDWFRRASDISQVPGPSQFDQEEEDKEKEKGRAGRPVRAKWGSQIEFLMSCIATSVGLGNVWRFPFVAFQNGGGAFLIPYMIVLLIVGKPMYYLECILGQFSSRNSVRIWSLCPAMKGTGYAQSLACCFVLSYYVMILSLCLIYLARSFESPLPWAVCKSEWDLCVPSGSTEKGNFTEQEDTHSSAELFFVKTILQQKTGIHDGLGIPIWYLALALLISWIIIFVIVAQGVKSSGRAAYFLALFPYVVMIILFITTVTLPGAGKGILFFIKPQWIRLIELDVWYAAVTQVFFSLGVCNGAIIMFSSYNGFDQNIYRDSMIVTTLDTLTSLLSGFTIFGILGNLAYNLNSEITDVVGTGGTGLAFVSYPDAIAKTFQPQVFAVLFFLMMAVLGVGSAVALLSTVNTVLLDAFPTIRTIYISAISCFGGFLLGVVYTTPGGQFILEMVDYYGGTFLVLFTGIAECAGIFWIYGLESFCIDVEYMLMRPTSKYWRFCWGIFSPLLMMIVFFYALLSFEALAFGGYYVYPVMAYVAGYVMLFSGILIVPAFIIRAIYLNRTGVCKETMKKAFASKKTWGPRVPYDLQEWRKYKADALDLQKQLRTTKCKHICMSLTGGYKKAALALAEQQQKTTTDPNIPSQSGPSRSWSSHSVPGQRGPGQSSPGQSGPGQSGPGQSGPGQSGPGQSGPGQSGPSRSWSSHSVPGQRGPGQSGTGQSGPGQSGPGQSGPGQSGPSQSGPSRSWSSHSVPGQRGPGQNIPGQSGPGQSGPSQSGPGQSGPGQSGPSSSWSSHSVPGQRGPGQSSPGQSGPGQSGPGQSSPGQSGPGQSGPGQSGPGQRSPSPSGPGQSGPGQSGPDQSGPGQSGPGQSGPGQSGSGQSGPGQSGPDRSGSFHSSPARSGSTHSGPGQSDTGQSGTGQRGTNQSGTDQSGTGQSGPGQSGTGQSGPGQSGPS